MNGILRASALLAALAAPALAQDAATTEAPATAAETAPAATAPAETTSAADAQAPVAPAAPDAAPATEAAPAADAAPAPAGEAAAAPQIGVGDAYIRQEFGAWQLRCVRTEDEARDPCQLYQLLQDQEGNNVAEISVFAVPGGGKAAAGATIITPLETLLTEGLAVVVDGGEPRGYPFSWCSAIGCIARIGLTAEELAQFKRGNMARLRIVPVAAPDENVLLDASLSGFTAGFDAVAANTASAAAAAAAQGAAPATAEPVAPTMADPAPAPAQ